MLADLIDIKGYVGPGYKPLVKFGTWRVAALHYLDDIAPDNINSLERHTATDEVFVLVKGVGMLVLGGNNPSINDFQTIVMKVGEAYNIKMNCWHNIVLSEDAHVIIIENEDTGDENSEHCRLPAGLQQALQHRANSFLLANCQ